MIIATAAAESMIIYGLDVPNAFQTNVEEKPYERGTKLAGRKWNILLSCILVNDLKMIQSSSDHSIFSWQYKGHCALIAVSTDDLLMAAADRTLFDRIRQCFDNHFNYTCTEGNI
eukprot:4273620-Ditylum_brightwellii.AAC.1